MLFAGKSGSNPFLNPKGWSAVKGWHNQGFNPIQSSPLLAADLPSPANYYPISGASNWQKVNSAISGVKKLSEKDKIRSEGELIYHLIWWHNFKPLFVYFRA